MENEIVENTLCVVKNTIIDSNEAIHADENCIICNGIAKHICKCLCGCVYCWECIEIYLNDTEKNCPGQFAECKDILLSIEDNILIIQSVKTNISRIVVKYSESNPKCIDDLINVKEYSVDDDNGSSKTIYSHFEELEFNSNGTNEHLISQDSSNTKLMMHYINNLTHEIKMVKSEISQVRREKVDLQMEIEDIKTDLKVKEGIISDLLINDQIKMQQIEYLMGQLGSPSSPKCNGSSPLVPYEPLSQLDDIDEIDTENDVYPVRPDFYRSFDFIRAKMEMFDKKLAQLKTDQEKLHCGEFVWAIDNFSEKIKKARKAINKEIYSEPFYSHKNGYKMCLRVDPSGISVGKGSHLAVYFCIMRGPYDDILQWPMKHSITFSLINQETGLIYTSRTVRFEDVSDNFAWNKPTDDKKTGFGYHKFISMDELLTNEDLCRNDRIFIVCSVDTS